MRFLKGCTTSLGVALLGLAFSSPVEADAWNRKTTITFSQPIEVPGVQPTGWGVLPAGTYVFKIMDSQANRHIVQIFDEDEKVVYATILAIPNYRLKATDKTVITFSERPAGQPEALRAWFYPGLNWGEEFVYPKEKAIELAKQTNQPVLFTPIAIKAAATEPIVSGTEPQVAELEQAPVKAVRPTGEEVCAELGGLCPTSGCRILEKYCDHIPTFNDDLQGSGAINPGGRDLRITRLRSAASQPASSDPGRGHGGPQHCSLILRGYGA